MTCLISKQAPDFTAQAVMPDNSIKTISLSQFRGQYVVLFFYPMDFTFVCPTEIVAFDKQVSEFENRNVQLIGVSVDSPYSHFAWKNTPYDKGGIGNVKYPLVADLKKEIAQAYGVLKEEDGVAFRGLFLIDREGVVQHMLINNLPLGRSVQEALRMVDALQFFEDVGEVCPANWKKGEEALAGNLDGVSAYMGKHAAH